MRANLPFVFLPIFPLLLVRISPISAKDGPIVDIPNQGQIMGQPISKLRVQKIWGYYGIPYARPPVQELRFVYPVTDPLPTWEGVKNLTSYRPSCLQMVEDYSKTDLSFLRLVSNVTDLDVDEDCLYLNIFVPNGKPPADGFTTVIWLHPGNFTTGSPSIWNPHPLVYRQQIILVTLAWRIGILGFFTTMDGESPGNFGLLDQQAAMMWVKNNIKLFGGNPDNICLMGYGTGGTSVALHLINEVSKSMFHKAIIMSSNFLNDKQVKRPQEDKPVLDALAQSFGCFRTPTSKLIECLRKQDGKDLVQLTSKVDWKPIIDVGLSNSSSPFLPDTPKFYFGQGDFQKVPLLTGYTNMEDILTVESSTFQNLQENATRKELNQILEDLTSFDLIALNQSASCDSNFEHIFESVKFFYDPESQTINAEDIRKIVGNYLAEKVYGASTYLLASYMSKGSSTYVYRFDMKPATLSVNNDQLPEWVTVPHLFDLIYIWGIPYWKDQDEQQWDLRDKKVSDTIMSFWANFAKYGNPTERIIYPIVWNAFKMEDPGILIIDGTFNMSNSKNFNYKAFKFWNEYYPKVVEISSECRANQESKGSSRTVTIYLHLLLFGTIIKFF